MLVNDVELSCNVRGDNMIFQQESYFLAKILGTIFIIFATAMLCNLSIYTTIAKKLSENPLLLFLVGTIELVLGIIIISFHNIWVSQWIVLITLAGWILTIRGGFRLIFPRVILKMAKKITGRFKSLVCVAAIVLMAYGGTLLYFSLGTYLYQIYFSFVGGQ